MNQLIQDVRFSLRQMRKAPGFTAVVVLTLSIGIGAAAAVFSVIDAVLIRPLPYANQDRLVVPVLTNRSGNYTLPSSYLGYLDMRAQLRTFDAMAGWTSFGSLNLEGPSGAVSLRAVKSTDNLFEVFGVKPLLGRTFLPGEDKPGNDAVTVLSYEVWQSQFGGQADAIGKVVRLDGSPYTVIGVMPAGFSFPLGVANAIYTPLHTNPAWAKARGMHWMRTVGLLKEGVSREQGEADLRRVMADMGRAYPEQEGGHTGKLVPLSVVVNSLDRFGNKTLRGPLGTLALAVLALLGIACVNVAGLLMARGVKREREVALRAAVGASRARLVRQMLTESVVLCVCGLAGGVSVSYALLQVMNVFIVKAMARGAGVHLNLTVVLVALGLSLLASVLASLAPAARLSGTDPNRALRAGGGVGTGRGQHRLRSGFVVTQVALSLVLLAISGLLLRNLQGLLKTNLGVDASSILTTRIALSHGRYEGRDPVLTFYQPLLERVSHLPGVAGAGVIDMLPIEASGSGYTVHITGQPPEPRNHEKGAETRYVSPGYFDAMGLKLTGGRLLSPALDKPENAGTMVVNEAFRKKFFSDGGDPVGAHIDDADKAADKSGIVGVVTNVRQDLQSEPMAEMDWLMDEVPPARRINDLGDMTLVVRSHGDVRSLIPALRHALHDVDPTVPFNTPVTLTDVVSNVLRLERLEGWLFGIFAGFAVLLAVIGLYGLINHEVELRTREIGIRMALGSTRGLVLGNVLRRVAVLMVAGLAVGLVLTGAAQKVLSAVVEIQVRHDALLLLAITAGLAVVGVLVGVLPARKAASVEPMQALRTE